MNKVELFLAGIVGMQSVFIFALLRQRWLANKAVRELIALIKGETK